MSYFLLNFYVETKQLYTVKDTKHGVVSSLEIWVSRNALQ